MPAASSKSMSLKTAGALILAVLVGAPVASAQPPAAIQPGPAAPSDARALEETASTHATGGAAAPSDASGRDEKQVHETFADLPLTFIENHGQTDPQVRYHAQGSDYAFFFTPEEVVLSFTEDGPVGSRAGAAEPKTSVLSMEFLGANPQVGLEAQAPTQGQVNFIRGNDPGRWNTGLPGYSEVVYDELWPGVDMLLRGQDGQLKYEFHVDPGTDPANIQLAYDGVQGLSLDNSGSMLIKTGLGTLQDSAPVSYQEIGGKRVPVESRYTLAGGSKYGFDVGHYQKGQELIIDPGLDYSTFVGGASADRAEAVTVDDDGNAVIVGSTQSTAFPTSTGVVGPDFGGGIMDAFITKLNADGSGLVYSTYLGGTPTPTRRGLVENTETARGVAVDATGNVYVTGQTSSGDFPITSGAFQTALGIGDQNATDGFVTKLNSTGGLDYSTFLGGVASDDGRSIAVDATGNAYVAGSTFSSDFPTTTGAFDPAFDGGEDVFVAKLNASGSKLAYSTYLGGVENELSAGIAVDSGGNAYVAGSTRSVEFPTTAGAFQPTHSGGGFGDLFEVFVTKLNSSGSGLVYSSFLGGTRVDRAEGLAIDSSGNAYVAGGTLSPEFPTTAGALDTTFDSTSESFVAKLGPEGANLQYSTFLGVATAGDITVDAANNAWIGGRSEAGATTTADAEQATNAGSGDAYIAQINAAGSDLLYATYLGGTDNEFATGIALDPSENIYVAGTTLSADFPTTPGAFDRVWNGDASIFWGDAFVAKFGSGTVAPPADANAPTVSISSPVAGSTVSGTVPVTAAASDDVGVTEVRFFANGDPIGTDTTGPYSVSWDTTTVANGSHVLTATAADAAGNSTTSEPVTVTVENNDPAPVLASLTVDPASVTGGNSSTGTVTLDSAALSGSAVVALSSSNTAAATVPADVTVPEGATSDTFPVSTSTSDTDATSTISATLGETRTATLTVTAPAAATETVTFSGRIGKNQTLTHTVSSGSGTVELLLDWDESRVDLDLRATDQAGNTVFFDGSNARPKAGSFQASVAGDYRFNVINNTDRKTQYTLTVAHPVESIEPPADTTAPTVSVTSPAPDSTVSGTVALEASAADDTGVTEVSFFADGTLVGTDSNAPYEASWDSTAVADGPHDLTATAVDAAGNTATSTAVTATVENTTAPPPADTAAPTVSISAPAGGSTVSGTTSVAATAADNTGVAEVRFFTDGSLIGTDTTDPYEVSWDTTTVTDGSHELTATAVDAAGNTGLSDPVTVTVENIADPPADNTVPTVGISNPVEGATVSGTATVTAIASDDVGVTQVRFSVDGNPIGTVETAPYEISWNTENVADGEHVLTATAFDAAGNTGDSAPVTVTVDNVVEPPIDTAAPTVNISAPLPGSIVSGTTQVSAAATDEVGVSEVRFFVDGTPIGTDTNAPYEIDWDTTTAANGARVLTAAAIDAAGNTGNSDPVTVTVDNTAPAPALASLTLDPASVTGGNTSTGTVTLDATAPEGGISVALQSSNTTAATVPVSMTIPEGATGATFTISTNTVDTDTSSTISATHNGNTRTAILTVTPQAADTVSITRAEYDSDDNELEVRASSSDASATLAVYVTSTNELIGTMSSGRGTFNWPTHPQNITVRSSLGGSATSNVQTD